MLPSMGSQKVRHDLVTEQQQQSTHQKTDELSHLVSSGFSSSSDYGDCVDTLSNSTVLKFAA